jgi:integrase
MPHRSFSDASIRTAPFSKKGVVDYTDKSRKYRGLILRVGKKTKTFYYKIHTATATMKQGFHFIADVTTHLNFEKFIVPEYEKFKGKVNASKKATSGFAHVTVKDYLEFQYQVDAKAHEKTVSDSNIKKIKLYFKHCLDKKCVQLTDEDYIKYIENWPNHSASTRRKTYYALSAMLNILVLCEKLPESPLKKRKFKKDKPAGKIKTHKLSYSSLYKAIFSPDFGKRTKYSRGFSTQVKLMFCIIVDIGARPSEVRLSKLDNYCLNIGFESVSFEEHTVKNLKPRTVPIRSNFLIAELKDFIISDGFIHNEEEYLFFNKSTKKPFASGCWRALYKEVAKRFSLDGRYYDFRHTFASKVYAATGDIKLVADLLGDTVTTAAEYYASDVIDANRAALKVID